ncbi:hypothetical protein GCM10007856_53710 [Azospirillum oryzae]|nr:hypothetical protein GCM10007856_53710 [Azospirillum oryzae]
MGQQMDDGGPLDEGVGQGLPAILVCHYPNDPDVGPAAVEQQIEIVEAGVRNQYVAQGWSSFMAAGGSGNIPSDRTASSPECEEWTHINNSISRGIAGKNG